MAKHAKGAKKKDVTTQTEEEDETMLEIARLQEQISLLTMENKVLRKHTEARSPPVTRSTPRKNVTKLLEQGSRSVKKGSSKGCSCKGNCGTKICGCLKKNKKCDHLCKCNQESCENKEDEDRDKNLVDKSLNSSEGNGLFSPVLINKKTNDNIVKYKLPRIAFNSSPNEESSSSDEENKDPTHKEKINNDTPTLKQNLSDQRKGRIHKRLLLPLSSISGKTQRSRSASRDKKGAKQKSQIEVHTLRKCVSNENEIFSNGTNDQPLVPLPKMIKSSSKIKNGALMPKKTKAVENIERSPETLNEGSKTQLEEKKESKIIVGKRQKEIKEPPTTVEDKPDSSVDRAINEKSMELYENDPNFDPTKPKHQLARTPPRSSSTSTTTSSPVKKISKKAVKSPIPKYLEEKHSTPSESQEAHVNWDHHQAELIPCDKCKRKFNPVRIAKHVAVCKGV